MSLLQSNILSLSAVIDPKTKRGNVFADFNSAVTITGATNATPIVVTAAGHGIQTGDEVYIASVLGNTAANNTVSNPYWLATRISSSTFSITDANGNSVAGNGAYTSGGTVVRAQIGSVDGEKFTRQRLLDLYNNARFVLFEAMRGTMSEHDLLKFVSSDVVEHTEVSFTSGVGTKPTGYIAPISMIDYQNNEIYIKDASYSTVIRKGDLPVYVETATNRFVIDAGGSLFNVTGTSVMPNSTATIKYYLTYFGLTTYTLTNVLSNSYTESYNDTFVPVIIELASAMANNMGRSETLALAKKLAGGK
jgi:hypothetical protein